MSDLQTRAQQLIDAGYYLAPARGYALLTPDVDPRRTPYTAEEAGRGPDLNIYHGAQRDGLILNKIDLDIHTAEQDADAAKAAFEDALPKSPLKSSGSPQQDTRGVRAGTGMPRAQGRSPTASCTTRTATTLARS